MSGDPPLNRLFTMGGFLDLSGLSQNQLAGPYATRIGASYFRRIGDLALFPAFAGVSVELGNVWTTRSEISAKSAIFGGSLWAGVQTPVGPGIRRLWPRRRRRERVLRVSRASILTGQRELTMAISRKTSTKARSVDLEALDLAHMFHPNTNLAALHAGRPLVLVRGEGVHVWDSHGKRYIEGMAGLWCTTLGYGDEELADTAYEQIKKLSFTHLFAGKSHEPGVLLADKLVKLAPFEASRVFFGNSGSDANDTQLKLALYYHNVTGKPQKKKIIARQKGYHGTTFATAGLTGLPAFHKNFDVPMPGILHTDAPYYYRGAEPGESEEDYASRLARNLETLILREDPDTIAAFIAEPLMGVGGVLLPPRTYFEKIQAVLARHSILLIDDEVITGFGRTGEIWGAQAFGMKPTTLTAAKALSSAYLPISAVIVPEFLYEPMIAASGEVGLFGHGFTYSGHPVSAAVALRALQIYEERKLYEHVRTDRSGVPTPPRGAREPSAGRRDARHRSRRRMRARARQEVEGRVRREARGRREVHAALPGARADRARDRRRDRAVSAVRRDRGARRRDLHGARARSRRHARVGARREAALAGGRARCARS